MSEWKELKIDDLPADINSGEYDFEYYTEYRHRHEKCFNNNFKQAMIDFCDGYKIRYRKKEKPAPTHEEIMTKWWKSVAIDLDCVTWEKFDLYSPEKGYFKEWCDNEAIWVSKEWFIDKESSDIPPEN